MNRLAPGRSTPPAVLDELYREMVVTTHPGLELVLADELRSLGVGDVQVRERSVECRSDRDLVWQANYRLTTALRVLLPICRVAVRSLNDVYQALEALPWQHLIQPADTIAVDSESAPQNGIDPRELTLRVKDAVVDSIRKACGRRPSVDRRTPRFQLRAHLRSGELALFLDSSRDSLHRRGYRVATVDAPLMETLAAGLVRIACGERTKPFALLDPFCGSGTIAIEAALMAAGRPPGACGRRYGFQDWPGYNAAEFRGVVGRTPRSARPLPAAVVFAGDRDPAAVAAVRRNAQAAGVERGIALRVGDVRVADQRAVAWVCEKPLVIVTNPPYGERTPAEAIGDLYHDFADVAKQAYGGTTLWLLSGNREALKRFGLRPEERVRLYNGPLACDYLHYEVFRPKKSTTESAELAVATPLEPGDPVDLVEPADSVAAPPAAEGRRYELRKKSDRKPTPRQPDGRRPNDRRPENGRGRFDQSGRPDRPRGPDQSRWPGRPGRPDRPRSPDRPARPDRPGRPGGI